MGEEKIHSAQNLSPETRRYVDQATDQVTDQATDQVTESISGSGHLIGSLEVLHGLFGNGKTALSEQFIRWKLWRRWAEYAGSSIGAESEPVDYQRGVLYVWVKNASWMQQLVFMLEPLKTTINKKLGFEFVRAIYLTLDRKTVPGDGAQQKELRESMKKLLTEGDKS